MQGHIFCANQVVIDGMSTKWIFFLAVSHFTCSDASSLCALLEEIMLFCVPFSSILCLRFQRFSSSPGPCNGFSYPELSHSALAVAASEPAHWAGTWSRGGVRSCSPKGCLQTAPTAWLVYFSQVHFKGSLLLAAQAALVVMLSNVHTGFDPFRPPKVISVFYY